MKELRAFLLLFETFIGFCLPLYLWVFGVIMSPLLLLALVAEGAFELVLPLIALVLGAFGVWGVLQLMIKVLRPDARVAAPGILLRYIACGLVALLLASVFIGPPPMSLVLMLAPPIVVSAHFLYLSRQYLWPKTAPSQR